MESPISVSISLSIGRKACVDSWYAPGYQLSSTNSRPICPGLRAVTVIAFIRTGGGEKGIILNCFVFCCTVLYCSVFYYIVLYCIVLCCVVSCCVVLRCVVLHGIA